MREWCGDSEVYLGRLVYSALLECSAGIVFPLGTGAGMPQSVPLHAPLKPQSIETFSIGTLSIGNTSYIDSLMIDFSISFIVWCCG